MNPKLETIDDLRAALAERFPGRSIVCSRNLWTYGEPQHASLAASGAHAEDYRVHVLRDDEKSDNGVAVEACKTPAEALEKLMAAHAKLCAKAPCSTCSGTGRVTP